jgi:hypothetical protein
MKAIVAATFAEVLLLVLVSVGLRLGFTERRARMMLGAFAGVLPVLVAIHFFTPPNLGFLSDELVVPIKWVDLAFALFLYAAGFFGGVLQLYNLADRGLSVRILIDILESPAQARSLDEVMVGYGDGRGIAWMYAKRLEDMERAGLTTVAGEDLVLTPKGRRIAALFESLQQFARIAPKA